MRYTLNDYEQIKTEQPENDILSEQTIKDFEKLYNLVNEYIATLPPVTTNEYTNYDKKKHRKHYKHNNRKYDNNGQWAQQVPFKVTKIEKKEGIDVKYSDMRSTLNKITLKNQETLLPKVIEIVNYIMNEDESDSEDEDIQEQDSYSRITDVLLDIVKKIKTGHQVYVNVLKEIIQCYPSFVTQITDFVTAYKNTYDDIIDIDANDNYDGYCDLVKQNDYRRSNSSFMINLTEQKLVGENELITIIDNLFDRVLDNIDNEQKTVLIEEITENLSIFIINSHSFLKTHSQWESLIEKLNRCSKLKAKEHKSISSRIVFKYMDIQDALKKMQ
tara:strand:- start:1861 stop:2850 length:990 start_codon:yes stop_codon:yes gene_type:complete